MKWLNDTMLAEEMIHKEDIELMQVIDDVDKVVGSHLHLL